MTFTYSDGTVRGTPISVNGYPLPTPSDMSYSREDLHANTERTASGILVADMIRANVLHLTLQWPFLANSDMVRFLQYVGTNMFKQVQYQNEQTGVLSSAVMYKSNLAYIPHRVIETGVIDGWRNITLNLIER